MKRLIIAAILLAPALAFGQYLSGRYETLWASLNGVQTSYDAWTALGLSASDKAVRASIVNLGAADAECQWTVNGTARDWFPILPAVDGVVPFAADSFDARIGPVTDIRCRTSSCTLAPACGATSLYFQVTVSP